MSPPDHCSTPNSKARSDWKPVLGRRVRPFGSSRRTKVSGWRWHRASRRPSAVHRIGRSPVNSVGRSPACRAEGRPKSASNPSPSPADRRPGGRAQQPRPRPSADAACAVQLREAGIAAIEPRREASRARRHRCNDEPRRRATKAHRQALRCCDLHQADGHRR